MSDTRMVIVLVYVDYLLIKGSEPLLIQATKQVLHSHFKMNDLGELKYFLGIEFCRSESGVVMNQRKYALELLSEAGPAGAQLVFTPLECNVKLTSVAYNTSNVDPLFLDITTYQRMIGKLLYLTNTRPDIPFAQPKHSHWNAALRVIKYIKGSPGLGLLMSSHKYTKLTGFFEADWAAFLSTRRSVTGYLLNFGDSLISWKSKKQNTVSQSSAEAEYRSLATLTAKVVWVTTSSKKIGCETSKAKIQDILSAYLEFCFLSIVDLLNGVVSAEGSSNVGDVAGAIDEGRFLIMSLSLSFIVSESSRIYGLHVVLSRPDRTVFGSYVFGRLIAATPLEVVVSRFIPKKEEPAFEGYDNN
uniref:PPC domain-containing protein n=1 Tax=Solanum lycopersicum TaxID=4081 RepID=A0A3Q7GWZ2_SOLLC